MPVAQSRATHDLETAELSGRERLSPRSATSACPARGATIGMRVYRRRGRRPLPLVAYLHGGGWVIGSLDGFDPLCRALANASGAVVASIDYRLAPEHPFPAAPDDARAAVRWLAEHAEELGADPARLGIAGDSAGGNLATVTARRLRDDGGPALRFQALIYPVCDSALNTPSYREFEQGFGLERGEHAALLGPLPRRLRRPPPGRLAAAGPRPLRPPARVRPHRRGRRAARRGGGVRAGARGRGRAGHAAPLRRPDHGFFRWLAKSQLSRAAVAEVGAALRAGLA